MNFDEEKTYDDEISPLVTKLIAICKEHGIPMAATFQYCDREEDGPGCCTTTIPIAGRTSARMSRIIEAMQPERPVAIAETTVTNPDGSKHVHIRRVQ